MRASATFGVTEFTATDYASPIATGTPIGQAVLTKVFTGEVAGRSVAQFAGAYDQATNTGTYVALEAFEGSVGGRTGQFAFAHTNTTGGSGAPNEHHLLVIVPGSGTSELDGIQGGGTLLVDDDGTHRLTLDYEVTDR